MLARNTIGDQNLMYIVATAMLATPIAVIYFWIPGMELRGVAVMLNFCTGNTDFMNNVLADYSGRTIAMVRKGINK